MGHSDKTYLHNNPYLGKTPPPPRHLGPCLRISKGKKFLKSAGSHGPSGQNNPHAKETYWRAEAGLEPTL